ncbi:hypothetical protein EG68_09468 [Paragonimus skrjabini miyazakii]|uniref:Uncharacterized protein n=1 Tax=Paragonimus skrjabini miyazakii TaxID=59628 RepID=A0A8S9YF59_9TREM|nr:hypothetical protein EG68_09468 [Paragonimus skrjabini miyazakii]
MSSPHYRQRPTLWHTNLEIRPRGKEKDVSPSTAVANAAANIVPLPKLPPSKLILPPRYLHTPHLTFLSQIEKDLLEKVRPPILSYDSWARQPYGNYHLTVSPASLHTQCLSHDTFSDPIPGRLPPLLYK